MNIKDQILAEIERMMESERLETLDLNMYAKAGYCIALDELYEFIQKI